MTVARSTDRTWLAGGAVGAVLLLLIAWFAVINPELSAASDLHEQTASASTQNVVLQRKVATLRDDYAKIDSLGTELVAQRLALPTGSGLADLTRQLTEQATAAGESLTSITTGEPALVATPAAAASAAGAATSGSAATTSAPAAAGATGTTTSTGGQLLSIPVTVVVDGSLSGHQALLTALQQTGPRRALVGSVVLAPATGEATASVDGTTTMTITLQVFVAPEPAAASAAAGSAAATTAPTAPTSATTPG